MSNLDKYKQVFISVFDVTEDDLNDKFTFADTDIWDSMSHITLISELEETFDVMFATDDILHFGSYNNGIEILKRYGVQFD